MGITVSRNTKESLLNDLDFIRKANNKKDAALVNSYLQIREEEIKEMIDEKKHMTRKQEA